MASQKLYIHRYAMLAYSPISERVLKTYREGVLLRTSEGGIGCIHPWPELGDAVLADEISALAGGTPLPLGARALECARLDGEARRAGVSLLTPDLPVPESYISLPAHVSDGELLLLDEAGFRGAKIKGGTEVLKLAASLEWWHCLLPEWEWRIDFNGTGLQELLGETFRHLSRVTERNIIYCEDPIPWEPDQWKILSEDMQVPLAVDMLPEGSVLDRNSYIPEYQVWKPAREPIPELLSPNLVVTSYMDHPVGIIWAAYEAARAKKAGVNMALCGLMTHDLYLRDEFSERMGDPSPVFPKIEGTGLGFDDLIERLQWTKI